MTNFFNPIKYMFIGIILFIGSFFLLQWNEGRAVKRADILMFGEHHTSSIQTQTIDPANNDKIIYITGLVTTNNIITDPIFSITTNSLKFKRNIEIFEWVEKRHENNGQTTYSYHTDWENHLIDSNKFNHPQNHANPESLIYSNQVWTANNINLGVFNLGEALISQLDRFYIPFDLTDKDYQNLSPELKTTFHMAGKYFATGDIQNPKIGDIRISFSLVNQGIFSIIGKQNNNVIISFTDKDGDLALLEQGTVGAEKMFQDAEESNYILTWMLRLSGFAMMWIGLMGILSPVQYLMGFIPILGILVSVGLTLITALIAFSLSLLTISIAWIAYRPEIAYSLIALSVIFFLVCTKLLHKAYYEFKKLEVDYKQKNNINEQNLSVQPTESTQSSEDLSSKTNEQNVTSPDENQPPKS